ncbi:MAG TPA: CehA/McbA family metallohydrolase, partial [Steroidobacteraceae bacterium]|nr:CehA/McbA family metallohydrolase [Steroidobacteraceae bacterium]
LPLASIALAAPLAHAERRPVLAQIDLPHPYYYREMFLPQLTSGPSSLAWSPDSSELIYSMAGSLWRQKIGSEEAQQLTAAAAYDYQPDWSPDGRWVIYSSYRNDALELWVLDLASGETRALTQNGAVNVEPRFSPDGKRIVFTSTLYHKRFHVFTADFADGKLSNIERATGEHKSDLPRYYYSEYDHEINPIWTRDGHNLIYVSNRNHIYGTGGMWLALAPAGSASATPAGSAPSSDAQGTDADRTPASAREIHYEESNWKARPDLSPDGSRLVYSSYAGRSWHNLWLMPASGGDAFPITYGDWDMTYPRWSPDGTRVAFVSNQSGSTEICWVRIPGGLVEKLASPKRRYRTPMSELALDIKDAGGRPASARLSVTDSAGRSYAPASAWMHADDGFDRRLRPFEQHYFHLTGAVTMDVPAGIVTVKVVHGMERRIEERRVLTSAAQPTSVAVNIDEGAWTVPDAGHWVSADVHVHMNYGGTYRNTPAHLVSQALAENLGMVHALIVNKEQRFPDIAYNAAQRDPASQPRAIVVHGQEFHTSYWAHLGLLNVAGSVILPGYAAYPNTAASSLYPMNADVADIGHARGALVGYVHPFDEMPEPIAKPQAPLTDELPLDMALGKVDYMEILGFSDHRTTAAVWYRLLNLGFRLPAAGGTDAMANFASLRGPVGMNRVYARVPGGEVTVEEWLASLKDGHTFATNGPLLGLRLGGVGPGDVLEFGQAQPRVGFSVHLKSIVPVDHLELVCNGRVVRSFTGHTAADHLDVEGTIPVKDTGWYVLRASTDQAREEVLDNYVYATTSPIYVTVAGEEPRSPEDAKYFAAWMDRLTEAAQHYPDWNNAAEKRGVLARIAEARAKFVSME